MFVRIISHANYSQEATSECSTICKRGQARHIGTDGRGSHQAGDWCPGSERALQLLKHLFDGLISLVPVRMTSGASYLECPLIFIPS